MSSHHNESTVTGKKFSRCHVIRVFNPFNGVPSIDINEEQLMVMDGLEPINVGMRHLSVEFNPTSTIALRDPTTDALTGKSITHKEVHAALYSLYRQAANAA